MTTSLVVLRRRFVILTALRWLPTGLIIPSMVLLLSARGMSLSSIGMLTAAYSAATVLLELPTGGLSDVLGRRPVLIAAASVGAVSSLLLALATNPAWLTTGFLLMGVSRALDSGPLQAWYVDSVHEVNPHAGLTRGLSYAAVAESGGLAGGALAAGLLAATIDMPDSGTFVIALSVPFLLKSLFAVVQIVALAAWVTEPASTAPSPRLRTDVAPGDATFWRHLARRTSETVHDVPSTITRGVRFAATRPALQRLLILAAAVGAALSGLELLAPVQAATLLGGETQAAGPYAVLVTLGFLGSASGSALAPMAARLTGSGARSAMAATIVGAGALAAVALPRPWGAAIAFVCFYLFLGVAGPLTDELMHHQVTGSERATVASLQSMALQSTAIVACAGLGALAAATSLALAFAVLAMILALGALTLVSWPAGNVGSHGTADEAVAPVES